VLSPVPPTARVGAIPFALTMALAVTAFGLGIAPPAALGRVHPMPTPSPTPNPPVVITFQIIPASRGAEILRGVYPGAHISVDSHANAVIVVAPGYEEQGMRTNRSASTFHRGTFSGSGRDSRRPRGEFGRLSNRGAARRV
jgi:hypothetical protein